MARVLVALVLVRTAPTALAMIAAPPAPSAGAACAPRILTSNPPAGCLGQPGVTPPGVTCPEQPSSANGGMLLDVTNVGVVPIALTHVRVLVPANYTPCPTTGCPSGTCGVGLPFYVGGPPCTGTSFPFQVMYRRKGQCSSKAGEFCTGSVRDGSFVRNASGTFLKDVLDTTATPPAVHPAILVTGGHSGAHKGSVPGSPAGNYFDKSWISVLNATLYGSMQIVDVPGEFFITVAPNETVGMWFLFMDATKSARAKIDSLVIGDGTAADNSTKMVQDSHLRLSYAMQASTEFCANWANMRPWTGSFGYALLAPDVLAPTTQPQPSPQQCAAPPSGGGSAVAAAVIGWLVAFVATAVAVRLHLRGGGDRGKTATEENQQSSYELIGRNGNTAEGA
jgi:hypothetical protein